jgi:5-methyltetrahydropteroyltriglutamate--homocysteine methyltransferase
MRRSTDGIIVSHVGALPRVPGVRSLPYGGMLDVPPVGSVAEATDLLVDLQLKHGVDVVNDGEIGKIGFLHYVADRFTGMSVREAGEGEELPVNAIARRDLEAFPGYFKSRGGLFPGASRHVMEATSEVRYVGQEAVQDNIRDLRAAMQKHGVTEGFLTAISPETVEQVMPNRFYANDDAYLEALANALHEEYKAITDAGLVLQIDDPGLAHAWQADPSWGVAETRKYSESRVEVLNHALRDCPPEQVRLHLCWGSYHGPHGTDLELKHFIDIVYKVRAECISIEGANARHEHEWIVFKDHPLPDGKSLMPGVVGHAWDIIEHPELVAQRLERWAGVVGKENVIAGTDCGLLRVHPDICWAKLDVAAEGARIASERLWG